MADAVRACGFSGDLSTAGRQFARFRPAAGVTGGRGVVGVAMSGSQSEKLFSAAASGSCSLKHAAFALPHVPLSSNAELPFGKRFGCLVVRCGGSGDRSGINSGGDGAGGGGGGGGDGGGGWGKQGPDGEGSSGDKNRLEALLALSEAGRSLESIPKDLASAIQNGRIPGTIMTRFLELDKSPLLRWLLQFGGFKERLLADDLFLAKVVMECGVGIVAKTAAEWERRRENFTKELDFVIADVAMAIIADFMLVWLPAPTVSLRAPLSLAAGPIAKFFHSCPDNAFQVALAGTSYSLLQRVGAVIRNGAKLFLVGTSASLVGTGAVNLLNNARGAFSREFAEATEDVPVVSTSAAYGLYMSVSSNLRYQLLAGVVEQRILEPLFHKQKLVLSALCFAVRTGNTFLGSLLWVDYARWIGVQQIRE